MDVTLVIPAYNESGNVDALVRACLSELDRVRGSHEIILIDDGSTDGTGELIDELARRYSLIKPVHHKAGASIGCHPSELEGLGLATGDVALFLPADLQIEPSVLPLFLEAARDADIVASRRFPRADPWFRRMISATNNIAERVLLRVPVHDAHSSMLLTRRALDVIVPKVKSRSAVIAVEILARARRIELKIQEIDIPHRPRVYGQQTGVRPYEVLLAQADLIRLAWTLRRETARATDAA
jgi:glycosyltransferase involved in cell wall biosynthesis